MKPKTLTLSLLALGALLISAPRSFAQMGEAQNARDKQYQQTINEKAIPEPVYGQLQASRPDRSLRIHDSPEPSFPVTLIDKSRHGYVRVLIAVDAQGKLMDYLLISYSRKGFARAVEEVLPKWTFDPAQLNGQPVSVVTEVDIEFDVGGVVINSDFQEIVSNFLQPWRHDTPEYAPASIKQIDRIPEPVKVVNPIYHSSMGLTGEVTLQFYINEQGKVRIPSVVKADHLALADIAIDALRQWEFSPPTYRGTPCLVKASQTFRFENKSAAAKPAPAK